MSSPSGDEAEWLEADGLGGFASGTVSGIRTRRYHALLLCATTPPSGRVVLVNGLEAWLETSAGTFALSSQRYLPDVVHPDGARRIVAFTLDPWPRWRFHLEDGTELEQQLFVRRGSPLVALTWRLASAGSAVLRCRPLLSGRDYHGLHHENPDLDLDPLVRDRRIVWQPYAGLPPIVALANGEYAHAPAWYRRFLYTRERERGLDCVEDLASPGMFRWTLGQGEAVLLLGAGEQEALATGSAEACLHQLRAAEAARRREFPSGLHRAADAYLVRRGDGETIVAGYPWFTDWGRDTFIALRGLCLATARLEEARRILIAWAGAVSRGMLPNRFPDRGTEPEFNSVDAALWYVVAVHELAQALQASGRTLPAKDRECLEAAVGAILAGYAAGTRYGIRLDADGLLAAGEPGVQLTWMDAKVGDWVVTPRIGKPVEVQALWLNALHVARSFDEAWALPFARGLEAFRRRFWHAAGGYLHDVVDAGHRAGAVDSSFRPNQILAVGGLPLALLEGDQARRVVDGVEARLWTPLGLRSLAPEEPGYRPRYEGGPRERDGAYHQGTAWPWLLGPFVEAWVRVRGGGAEAKRQARARFLDPVLRHLDEAGLGHVSEIADGEAPHRPRGCPFQAWSVGETLRLMLAVLGSGPA